ncbi:MAG TPA: G1 family glutamic endopeptidase [Nocardioidaceae bacterium]|nr:G1 family glutamic endopeptidase [Nocardioidaceae bacterium]
MPVPPQGWNPIGADPKEIAQYGFPPKPTTGRDEAAWMDQMSRYKATPIPRLCSRPWSGSESVQNVLVTANSASWSGYSGEPIAANNYVAVSGEFDQPGRLGSTCVNPRQATWVGLGGARDRPDGSGGLLQTGTARTATGAPYAWFEWIGHTSDDQSIGVSEQVITSLDVAVGDHIHLSVFYQTSNSQANFIVQNETTGQYQSIIQTFSNNRFYDGRDADFITERPKVGGQLAPLQNFGTVTWNSVKAQNQLGDWQFLDALATQVRKHMTADGSSSATRLATAGSIGGPSGGAFTTTWNACGVLSGPV